MLLNIPDILCQCSSSKLKLEEEVIESWKILQGFDRLDAGRTFLQPEVSGTMGHSLRIMAALIKINMEQSVLFFSFVH